MRSIRRLALGAATLTALLGLVAGTALAGNFAEVTMLDSADDPPRAGESRDIEFRLLQHGVTPVTFGDVQLTATLPGSDDEIVVPATSLGDGRWTATVTFPAEGQWQVRVTHSVFETSAPTTLQVAAGTAASATGGATSPWTFLLIAGLAAAAILGTAVIRIGHKPAGRTEPVHAG